jgi:hypothetical protein
MTAATNGAAGPSLPASVAAPPGGSTPLLCPDGSLAPDNDIGRCGSKPATGSPSATLSCPDGLPAPDGDLSLCPPPGAPTNAWSQNKHGEWIYLNGDYPDRIYPLSKQQWVRRTPSFVTSDGKLTINRLLAVAGVSAPEQTPFFVANPNLRNVDPNAALPSGTILNVPKDWEPHLSTAGLHVNTSLPVGVGAQPCPPGMQRGSDGNCHPLPPRPAPPPPTRPAPPRPAPPPPIAARPAPPPPVVRPCPPGQTHWADGSCHPLPPSAQPQVTTGWVQAPSGHRWYRDASRPGQGYDPNTQQWVPENQLALAAAIASGDTVGAQQLQYAASGGAVQSIMAQNAAQQAALTAGQGGGYAPPPPPTQQGWVQGPQGSWRYLHPGYPQGAYDQRQRRWMPWAELQATYGG